MRAEEIFVDVTGGSLPPLLLLQRAFMNTNRFGRQGRSDPAAGDGRLRALGRVARLNCAGRVGLLRLPRIQAFAEIIESQLGQSYPVVDQQSAGPPDHCSHGNEGGDETDQCD